MHKKATKNLNKFTNNKKKKKNEKYVKHTKGLTFLHVKCFSGGLSMIGTKHSFFER